MYSFRMKLAASAVVLVSATLLNGCFSPTQFLSDLDAVPQPRTVLMARLPTPNCSSANNDRSTAKTSKDDTEKRALKTEAKESKPKNGKSDDESPEDVTESAAAAEKESGESAARTVGAKTSEPSNEAQNLKEVIECLQRAEQKARTRLHKLQAATAKLKSGLAAMRRRMHADAGHYVAHGR